MGSKENESHLLECASGTFFSSNHNLSLPSINSSIFGIVFIFCHFIFSVNLEDGSVCELPRFPEVDQHQPGPILLNYEPTRGYVVACSERGPCFTLSENTTWNWESIAPIPNYHCHKAGEVYAYEMGNRGLWVGDADCFYKGMNHQFLTLDNKWITIKTELPYQDFYPRYACLVALNTSHILLTGGWNDAEYAVSEETWLLDLDQNSWTSYTPLLAPRLGHNCALTPSGQVLIVGGLLNGENSVQILDPVTKAWSQGPQLPPSMSPTKPGMMLMNQQLILLEMQSNKIWLLKEEAATAEGFVWDQILELTLEDDEDGNLAEFVASDTFTMVPESFKNACL